MKFPGSSRRRPALLVLLLVILAGSYLTGFVSADQDFFPSGQLRQIKENLKAATGRSAPPPFIETSFLRLNSTSVQVPAGDPEEGGGITPVDGGVLGLTGSGEFFRSTGDDLELLRITPPTKNRAAYEAAAESPEFSHLQHDMSSLRYLSPLYVEHQGERLLFISYTEWQPDEQCYQFALARLDIPPGVDLADIEATAEDWRVIFRSKPCLDLKTENVALEGHVSGGAMLFDAERGQLLVTVGDYRVDGVYAEPMVAQDDAADYGKLLALAPDGSFVSHIAKGLRNPQGLLRMPDGEIWTTEHGPRGGDEINRIVPGGNLGWPLATLGTRYSGMPWPLSETNGRHDADERFEHPVYGWVPSVGIGGIALVEGFDPAWDGDILAGSMRGQSLYRLRIADNRVQFAEPIPLQERIRQVRQLADGRIALWTGSRKVMWLARSPDSRTAERVERNLQQIARDENHARAIRQALEGCLECHSMDPGAQGGFPSLVDVHGRAVASTSFPGYSASLRARGGAWTRARLMRFLADPQAFAPGSSMPRSPLSPDVLAGLAELLESLDTPE